MNNKVIAVLVVFSLVALWDLNTRLLWDTQDSTAQKSKSAVNSQLPLKLSKKQRDELAQQYLAYTNKEVNTEVTVDQGMSSEEQSRQNGRLDQFYAGDLRIRLSAVIRQLDKNNTSSTLIFALLEVQNIKETHTTLEKIQTAQQLYGYKVQTIRLNQITLVSLNDVNRVITLPIYQKRSAASSELTLNRKSL